MSRDLAEAPQLYRPGDFWEELVASNLEMLRSEGIDNFKRTVSNNYYNWLATSLRDPQIQRAVRRWLQRPALAPLANRMAERPQGLRTTDRERAYALSRAASWRYKFFVGAAWEAAREYDTWGLTDRLSEPLVGNPIRIE
ncbi:MAG: class I SAM-dependent methyltransferase, partial [Solirubrobacteraceae bacterium]